MKLAEMTYAEVEEYLTQKCAIVLPFGSIEQHGPSGLLGTDVMCPELILDKVLEMESILVGPTHEVGCAFQHMAFAGTITLRPTTMIRLLRDVVMSLHAHGFKRFYLFNGHGGNMPVLKSAVAEIYEELRNNAKEFADVDFRMRVMSWWELPGIYQLIRKLYPDGHGFHATPSEIALTLTRYRDGRRHTLKTDSSGKVGLIYGAHDFRKNFPDGLVGSMPELATAEDGEHLLEIAAAGFIKDFRKFTEDT